MKPIIAALVLALFTTSIVRAGDLDPVNQPTFAEGDSWIYADTEKKNNQVQKNDTVITIERLQDDKMLVSFKDPNSGQAGNEILIATDWHRTHDMNGVETIVNRPLAFPLTVGKTWHVEFTENNPQVGRRSETHQETCKVVGLHEIKVLAGPYKALKIQCKGTWSAEIAGQVFNDALVMKAAPNVAASRTQSSVVAGRKISGLIYREFYYVPAIKRWVKSIEDIYDVNNRLTNSSESELKDFHAATP